MDLVMKRLVSLRLSLPAEPSSVRPFPHNETCTLHQNLRTSTLEATANAAEIQIEDFQDLVNLRLCFQPGPPCFNVGLYPLGGTAAASEIRIRRPRKASSQYGGRRSGGRGR